MVEFQANIGMVPSFSNIKLKMCFQKLRRIWNNARLFLLGRERDLCRSPHRIVSPLPEIRSDGLPRLQSWNQTCKSWFARIVPCCLPDRTFRTSGTVVCKHRNRCFQLSSPLSVLLSVWASWGGTAMLQTAVRVVESPSPLLAILSLFSAKSLPGAYGSGFPTLMSSGRGFDTDCPIVLTASASPDTAAFIAVLDDCWRTSIICAVSSSSWRLSISTSWADAIATRYPNTAIPGINQYPNSRNTGSATMQEWKTTQNGCKVRCAQGWELFSMRSDLGPRRLCEESNVTVMSTVSGCDVTTVQLHYMGSTSIFSFLF